MYIDVLSQSQEFDDPDAEYKNWLNNLRELVDRYINDKNLSIRTKYMWLFEKINALS